MVEVHGLNSLPRSHLYIHALVCSKEGDVIVIYQGNWKMNLCPFVVVLHFEKILMAFASSGVAR